ncbi:MAG TPA: ABC transporter ATP-binding protein [Methylomirabilota bacterium]|jgi:putative ABC transport system ATP-binding protein
MDLAPLVELRGVTKVYREGESERVVLRGVDVSVARGEFLALLGRSGSGKSTLLNLISGIDAPTTGDILVDGTAVALLSESERTRFRRHRIGFVFQFFNLIPTLTVLENLLLPLEMIGRAGAAARAEAETLLHEVALADRRRAYPDRLSGGEQQRIAVARALVHDPELILADEPTGNLDGESAGVVLALLARLSRERKKTVIAATHSAEVAGVASRLLVLRDGRLAPA